MRRSERHGAIYQRSACDVAAKCTGCRVRRRKPPCVSGGRAGVRTRRRPEQLPRIPAMTNSRSALALAAASAVTPFVSAQPSPQVTGGFARENAL